MLETRSTILLFGTLFCFNACSTTVPDIQQHPVQTKEANTTKPYREVPPPPKKKIELKEVQDDNYSPEYMYPDDQYKKDKPAVSTDTTVKTATPSMTKEECVSMIGQEKFNKYSEMFGNESAPLKRCTLLKSMQQG
jgi:hypothetical protein